MQKVWTPPPRLVFGAATLLGFFSTLQAYRLSTLNLKDGVDVEIWRLLTLNLVYWYVPAALTPAIFRLGHRFPLEGGRWPRAVLALFLSAIAFSLLHVVCMLGMRQLLWGRLSSLSATSFLSVAQSLYLTNLDWALMTFAAIVGLSYALSYHREAQDRELKSATLESQLAHARLKTLEAELHPHFLFNTLHAISTLVHSNPDAADRMISRLSDLLRITLDRSAGMTVALQEELEFPQKYLEIEQTRFQDRLTVRFEIDPDTLDAAVPRLILQPIVENAIKHGISKRTGPGLVQIGAHRDGDALWLEVRDNGGGLTGITRDRLNTGVGLTNTRERLQCLYDGAQALEISDGQGGLTVRMRIPFNRVPPTSDAAATRVA